jgi:putative hemolysin
MAKKQLIKKEQIEKLITSKVIKPKAFSSLIMKTLKLDQVNRVYGVAAEKEGAPFADAVLRMLHIDYDYPEDDLKNIPLDEPFIVVANHPYGGIDGLIMLSILSKKRPDFKIMANYVLSQIPELSENFISVNPFENKKGLSISGIKKSIKMIAEGHPIGIFPAGEVFAFKINTLSISDKMWSSVVGKMILKSNVKVVPMYFSGKNSLSFNILGLIHPSLRTAKLPSELFNKQNDKILVRIGKPVSIKTIQDIKEPDQLLRFLRAKTYALGSSLDVTKHFKIGDLLHHKTAPEPIIDVTPTELMAEEIKRIESKSLLFKHHNFGIYLTGARFIPNILREISRLREITFRSVGEGTNKSYDSDEFDLHYKHLFIWDHEAQKLVGSYRIGLGDVLYRRYKKKGFYLNELFKMNKEFSPYLKSSLEMGRSFIVAEYQKKPLSLMLLWKGVLEFLKKENNRYKYLIGPVSISNNFSKLSKDLLVDYIYHHHYDEKLATMVQPRKKYTFQAKGEAGKLLKMQPEDMKMLDDIISDIEISGMKMPVLLKKYLKQNAKIIAFNIDPKFNNSLDGFLIMDFSKVPTETIDLLN